MLLSAVLEVHISISAKLFIEVYVIFFHIFALNIYFAALLA